MGPRKVQRCSLEFKIATRRDVSVPYKGNTMADRPHLTEIRLHPIKSLDGVAVPECRIGPGGGLELDRVWALYSADGRCINGKSTAAMHLVRAVFAPEVSSVTLSVTGREDVAPRTFAFPGGFAAAGAWFSRCFGRQVTVRYVAEGVPDDTDRNGPTVISRATLEAVADWFPEIDLEESRRRFRTSLEIGGVGAFWEDRLFGVRESDAVQFTVGDVHIEGANPCPRCAVPARDSSGGIDLMGSRSASVSVVARITLLGRANLTGSRVPTISESTPASRRPNMGRC